MIKSRRSYSKEFKLEAVQLTLNSDKSVKEIASDLGISYQLLCKWRSAYKSDNEECFPGKGNLKPSEKEYHELRKKVLDLEEEREILKKALAIFSSARSKNTGL
ncbi:transposase [Deferribacter autotrophicus]|uniref:Transposase n=1 Tax=Deferribacter autotrophicus TaxID=500465 RepID=A0A5A8F5F6_9BACT|nr:transposase [Deferribacter autotrophicus]KAA0257087.1 transposase [Deferribacter autotrophicus]